MKKRNKKEDENKMGFWDHPIVDVLGYVVLGVLVLLTFAFATGLSAWILKVMAEFFGWVIEVLP